MSILIMGMEMPKNCFECPWRCKVDPENLLCRISGEYFEETFSSTIQNRHKSCHLVPVPQHGRLIDADKEMARVQKLYDNAIEKDPDMGCVNVYEGEIAVLQLAPTIIPAEEGE